MNYPWLDEYLLAKPGATKLYKGEWEATLYQLAGKMFAMVGGDKQGRPIVTLKLDPSHGDMLRQQYADIIPGYYMNKLHWNSLYLEGVVPDEVVKQMADESHQLILEGLSKKQRQELLAERE